ncbi:MULTISPECIES: DUF4145 domain-containing protein [unclassified Polaromonas]|uniref:DUF4145 domain-containing protein n=1 Tax=unclassified Polaromonas TaxID=2638319 RepID=UPI000F074CAC|nr:MULTISPECIES: DUF4145 domain-containing protein [unclassified Polaromonas]AYQ26821.1 DUF4145 domain-containing protein [Polaromonas sp. SP1]QGJ18334.1 DUF4145 domain-containing protein [Polaromonas sp. Pch-P]
MHSKLEVRGAVGDTIKIVCSKCNGSTSHKILTEVEQSWSTEDYDIEWGQVDQIVQCLGCEKTSYRLTTSNSENTFYDDEGNAHEDISETLYPPRHAGRKGIEHIWQLPFKVQGVYKETLQAILGSSPVLAGIGLRLLLETICGDKRAEGVNLYDKITNLVERRILTPQSAEILHHIRTLGNNAAHEAKPHSANQLSLAMEVIEHLLHDVYLLPARAAEAFPRPPVAIPPQ